MEILFYLSTIFMKFPFFYLFMISIMLFLFIVKSTQTDEISPVNFLILLYIFFLFFHLIFISNINFFDIFNVKYLRTEGRIFFTFIPFLYFSTFGLSDLKIKKLFNFFYYTFSVFAILSILHFATPLKFNFLFYGPMELFSGFFPTKNSAGNFIGFIIISFFFTGSLKKNYEFFILFLLLTVFLLANSRQAIIGVLLTLIFYFVKHSKLNFQEINLKRIFSFLSIPFLIAVFNQNVITRIFSVDYTTINIFYRMNSWIEALNLFSKSPILGIGFNRFGDFNKDFFGIEGFFYFARDGLYDWLIHYNHPHNQYFLILSETGIVGIVFYLSIFYYLFKSFNEDLNNQQSIWGNLILVYTLSLGLFGNGIEAPSVGLPFGLIIGSLYYKRMKLISKHKLFKNML